LSIGQRIVLGLADGPGAAVQQAMAAHGGSLRGLMVGWQANLARDVPFAVFKLSLYEACVRAYESTQGHQPASAHASTACGVASGCVTAVLTNPLDVLNTRIKGGFAHLESAGGAHPSGSGVSGSGSSLSMATVARRVVATEGVSTLLLSGLAPRMAILGLGSGVFWGAYAHTRSALGLDALAR
jgi:hypothetical protein